MKYIILAVIINVCFSLGTLYPPPEPKGLVNKGHIIKRQDIYARYDSIDIKYDSLFNRYNLLILEVYNIRQLLYDIQDSSRKIKNRAELFKKNTNLKIDSLESELAYYRQMMFERDSINTSDVRDLQDRFITFQSAQKIKNKRLDNKINELKTLDFMDADIEGFDSWAAPPSKEKGSSRKFVVYDKPPTPKKALSPRYPDICKTAGIEGRVVVEFYIDETGKVDQSSVAILNSIPCLDQACINEIKKSKWKPARQGKEKVGVYLTKTFKFTLVK